jgi:hypothetical protein
MTNNATIPAKDSSILGKRYELVKFNEKYYIELNDCEDPNSIVQLSISLAADNDLLRLRIKMLERKIKVLENSTRFEF